MNRTFRYLASRRHCPDLNAHLFAEVTHILAMADRLAYHVTDRPRLRRQLVRRPRPGSRPGLYGRFARSRLSRAEGQDRKQFLHWCEIQAQRII